MTNETPNNEHINPSATNILLVDDEIDILETVSDAVEFEFMENDININIDTAENGLKALELFNSTKNYDLVVTDLNMPIMGGVEFVSNLKNQGSLIPIIVFSGHGDIEEGEVLNKLGVNGMIKKPFIEKLIDELFTIVKNL